MKVFVIAGVGDHIRYIKNRTSEWKKAYDFDVYPTRFGWKGNYENNYKKLKLNITDSAAGECIALIGISAGGSAAIRLSHELENVSKVITICARTSRGGFKLLSLSSYTAYWESVDTLRDIQVHKELLVIKPRFDEIVSVNHMNYENAKYLNTKYLFHIPAVLNILSKEHEAIANYIKK